MQLPDEIVTVVGAFAPLFSARVWEHAQVLLVGAVLCYGRRTVSAVLRVMGRSAAPDFSTYHRVLNRVKWDARLAGRILFGLLLVLVPSGGAVVLGADDTLERRNGRKLKAKGCYRDAVRSSKKHVIKCFGLKWVSLLVLVPVPWSRRVWGLPFLTVLSWPKGTKRRHKTSNDWVRQMMKQVRRWLPERAIVLVVDGAFACVALARACVGQQVVLVSRLRWDAALYHWPAAQPSSKRGRKPSKGQRQRRLKEWAARADTPWAECEVAWYGGQRKKLLVFTHTALWYTPGQPPLAIRYVITRDPAGKLRDEVFFCTDLSATPVQIVEWVVLRWSVEVTFEEARAHLGVETQRQWADPAIARTTPVLFGLFSLVTLLTVRLCTDGQVPVAQTAWYRKEEATFSDCLALVRQQLWRARYLVNSAIEAEIVQFPRPVLELLFDALAVAA